MSMVKAVVLSAGKGKRLHSEQHNLPKVMRRACGKPLLGYVLDNIAFVPQEDTYIVVGYKKETVIDEIKGRYNFVSQDEQLGTGHAVMMAEPYLKDYDGDVIVLYGDMPLVREETYKGVIARHKESGAGCTLVTGIVEVNPPDYGRVIRNSGGEIIDIVEKKDCTPEQVKISELNIGIYVFKSRLLFESLKSLNNNNSQKEYYLTDVPKILIRKGVKVNTYTVGDLDELLGVNTPEDLAQCERLIMERQKH